MAIKIDNIPQVKKTTKEKKASPIAEFLNKDIKLLKSKFSDKKKEKLYSELQTLLKAGIDIRSALELIEDSQSKESDKLLINKIKEFIVKGGTFNEALKNNDVFTPYEFNSIKIGEESGRLLDVLSNIQAYYQRQIEQKRLVVNALSYPVIVLLTAFGAVFFLMRFVVPMFKDLFARFNADLPTVTKLVLSISGFIGDYSLIVIFLSIGFFVLLYFQRKKEWYLKLSSAILLRIPYIGNLVRKIHLARFCQTLSLLISAKTPIVNSLKLTQEMLDFYPIKSSLQEIQERVTKGDLLNNCMSDYSIYDKKMIALIRVGEEANQLDKMFDKLYNQYNEETKYQLNLLGTIVEPLMIVFLGGIVAIILVAMYLPLFKLSSGIH